MRFYWILVAAGAVLVFAASSPAVAGVEGPCTIVVDGQDLAGVDTVVVPANGTLSYDISAAAGVAAWSVDLTIAGVSQTVSEGTSEAGNTQVAGSANVSEYASAGVGLYEVDATASLANGESCSADFLVRVLGNPLMTVAGAVAAVAAAGGTAGLGVIAYLGFKP